MAGAHAAGIDLGSVFGTIEPASYGRPAWVRHAVLSVLGAGRTAMLFQGSERGDESDVDLEERVSCLLAASSAMADKTQSSSSGEPEQAVCLVQSLPEPSDAEAVRALFKAEFLHVGDLAYLKRGLYRADAKPALNFPKGFSVRPMTTVNRGSQDRTDLARALELSYEQTLDCPELCGLRAVDDVIDSHAATGRFDPGMWWIVRSGDEPVGCGLFNPVPETRSAELVYLGLGPTARGHGLGRTLLMLGISTLARVSGASELLCAVDERNAPALRLYESVGFRAFSSRRAFVRSIAR